MKDELVHPVALLHVNRKRWPEILGIVTQRKAVFALGHSPAMAVPVREKAWAFGTTCVMTLVATATGAL